MSLFQDIAKGIAGYMGGTALEGPQEGKTAHQITAMLSGAMRSTGKAPSKTSLPKQKPIEVEMTPSTWRNQAKIFPNSPIVRQEAEKERVANINLIHRQAGRKKMGRETTDPAHLALFSGGPPPAPVGKKKSENKLNAVLRDLVGKLPTAMAIVGVGASAGAALVKFPGMVRDMSMDKLKAQAGLSRYSGKIARTMALMNVQDVRLGIRTARATAVSIAVLGKTTRELRNTLQPYEAAGIGISNIVLASHAVVANAVVKALEFPLTFGNPQVRKALFGGGKADEGLPFQTFLQTMNPPVAQARNERVAVREAVHRKGA